MKFIKLVGTNKNIYYVPAASIVCMEQLSEDAIPLIGVSSNKASRRCALRVRDVQGLIEVAHTAEEVIVMIEEVEF